MLGTAYPEGWPEGRWKERNTTESPAWENQEDPEDEPKVGGGSEGNLQNSAESGLYLGFHQGSFSSLCWDYALF